MKQKINLKQLSSKLQAYKNCIESKNTVWEEKHLDAINEILEALPSGSGIDSGVKFDLENSSSNKLVFTFGFHHLNKNGYYDGWTDHKLKVTPTFGSFDLLITGVNRNQIKDYLYDLFYNVFTVSEEIITA